MQGAIEEIKLIRLNSYGVNLPDDPSFPFKLEVSLIAPEFMSVAFVAMYGGTEEAVLRGMTKEALDRFVKLNQLRTHPRLRKFVITGPTGILEQVSNK